MRGLNSRVLKMVAVSTMLIDHIGAALLLPVLQKMQNPVFYEQLQLLYTVCRKIGRISFPIYCFLLVEGFFHTRNVKKYAGRLAVFALISEIPFDLAFYHTFWYPGSQNVFFTLLIGLCTLSGIRYFQTTESKTEIIRVIGQAAVVVLGIFIALLLDTDYSVYGAGVIAITLMYYFRGKTLERTLTGMAAFSWELPAPLAMFIIWFYNGEKGKGGKYFFYWFYPVHLLILWAVCGSLEKLW